jgi:hypothetical protein
MAKKLDAVVWICQYGQPKTIQNSIDLSQNNQTKKSSGCKETLR